jgi:hypothetical protein
MKKTPKQGATVFASWRYSTKNGPTMPGNAPTEPVADAPKAGTSTPAGSARAQGEWVVERPEPGLARGKYPWPDWGIAILGVTLVVVGLIYLLVAIRRSLKR